MCRSLLLQTRISWRYRTPATCQMQQRGLCAICWSWLLLGESLAGLRQRQSSNSVYSSCRVAAVLLLDMPGRQLIHGCGQDGRNARAKQPDVKCSLAVPRMVTASQKGTTGLAPGLGSRQDVSSAMIGILDRAVHSF